MIEKILAFISENWMLLPNQKSNIKEKNFNYFKNVTTIYDHLFDIIEKYN